MSGGKVFTVGYAPTYDRSISELGDNFQKLGRTEDYAGGFAVSSFSDAERLIDEFDQRGMWAVYELAADWERDTVPSDNGWWHALVKDSVVIRKVEAIE